VFGNETPLQPYPNIQRWFAVIDARPAVARARAVGSDHVFKKDQDDAAKRHLYPSNYPPASVAA
jgi:GST-like protein